MFHQDPTVSIVNEISQLNHLEIKHFTLRYILKIKNKYFLLYNFHIFKLNYIL